MSLQLDIAHDKFIRTTNPKHEAVVNEFYSRVLANGDIYRADYEGLYCVNCEEYKVCFYVIYSPVNCDGSLALEDSSSFSMMKGKS